MGVTITTYLDNTLGTIDMPEPFVGGTQLYLATASTATEARFSFNYGEIVATFVFQGAFGTTMAKGTFGDAFNAINGTSLVSSMQLYAGSVLIQEDTFPSYMRFRDIVGADTEARLKYLYAGNDIYTGSTNVNQTGIDFVKGRAGNDIFYGYGGPDGTTQSSADTFHGGDGIDTSAYRNKKADYTIEKVSWLWNPDTDQSELSGLFVTDKTGLDGIDCLYQVERLKFSDYTLAYDTSGTAGQTYRIYKAAFDRDPMDGDKAGLGYWVAMMDDGMAIEEVALRFIDSTEFRTQYGSSPTNAEFLTRVYSNVLDRIPDDDGLAWWVNAMNTDITKTWGKVLADFSESAENQANVASLIAEGIIYEHWAA